MDIDSVSDANLRRQLLHNALLRAVASDSASHSWTLRECSSLAKANWEVDSRGTGALSRAAWETSMVALARAWASSAAATPSLHLSIRCIAAGAGLPDDLPTALLFCLVQVRLN
eukprot:tig00020675_g12688.t1